MFKNKSLLSVVLISSPLFLVACGESDSGSASAPASAPAASAPAASAPAASGSDGGGSIEKAEGVVYMDEIYANWPYN